MFLLRFLTTIVLAPLTLIVFYLGEPFINVLILLTLILIIYEYIKIVKKNFSDYDIIIMYSSSFFLMILPLFNFRLLLIFIFLFSSFCILIYLISKKVKNPLSDFFFYIYVLIPAMSLILLYDYLSFITIFWFLLIIWSTDIGAYIFGNILGGVKLVPNISPNKTWSGAIGGLLSAVCISTIYLYIFGYENLLFPLFFSCLISIIGQIGDIVQSYFKRVYNVKDSGWIIPGHGGVMDRVDSLWLASPILLLISWFYNGGVEFWHF